MPGNDCLIEELAFADRAREFDKAADAAETIRWIDLGFDVLSAYVGGLLGGLAAGSATAGTGTGVGVAIGAAPGLIGFYRDLVKDLEDIPAANDAAKEVSEAFDKLQECREQHEGDGGADPFGEPPLPSVFDGMPIIPYQDPDPDPEVSDDEIIIFDEDDFGVIKDEEGDIIIIDEG